MTQVSNSKTSKRELHRIRNKRRVRESLSIENQEEFTKAEDLTFKAQGFLYIISMGHSTMIKVGRAQDPITRMKELQVGNPYPLSLQVVVLVYPDEPRISELESLLHELIISDGASIRVSGEWFSVDEDYVDTIINITPNDVRTLLNHGEGLEWLDDMGEDTIQKLDCLDLTKVETSFLSGA